MLLSRKMTPIQRGSKRMQQLRQVFSMTWFFFFQWHWFLFYWVEVIFKVKWHQDHRFWLKCFDSRAIFVRQCHFQNLLLRQPLEAARNFHQSAFHRISCVDKHTTITTLRNELNASISSIVVFVFKVNVVMCLSTQLILWNAIWWKFIAAQAWLQVPKQHILKTTLPHKK